MSALARYFDAPIAAARAYLFSRLFLIVVALDAWMLMIGHAGRYGVDGFNVAHFAWLDRLAPLPSAALYVAVLLLSGWLALSVALGATQRSALVALFVLYTYSWAMSMLDSYQHHYFVSSVLLCLVFFPRLNAHDVHAAQPAAAPAPRPAKNRQQAKREPATDAARRRSAGRALYVGLVLACCGLWLGWPGKHGFVGLALCGALAGAATWFMARREAAEPRLTHGFGYNLLGVNIAILYVFTSVAKMDAAWTEGHTLTRISAVSEVFAPLAQQAEQLGLPAQRFWGLFATSVIPLELTIALTYLVAVVADASRSAWPRRIALLGFVLAISLHLGAEAIRLEIGWFSYYMMLLATAYLLPARGVDMLTRVLTLPAQLIQAQLSDLLAPGEARPTLGPTLGLGAATALTLLMVGNLLDLPGAPAAGAVGAFVAVASALALSRRDGGLPARPALLAGAVAAALMWLAIASSEARWDFYRYLGGDLRRRGESAAALEAYKRGERHAPKGQSRRDQIEALRKSLGR